MLTIQLDPEVLQARYHRLVSECRDAEDRALVLRGQALELLQFIESLDSRRVAEQNAPSAGE